MLKILVLADDLTGAAEIGGVAYQFGLSVRILLKPEGRKHYPENVIIIDSNSRSLSPEEAFQKVEDLLSFFDLSEFSLVYKKADSILRGPIVSEITALFAARKLNSAVLVPANPSRNRIIRSGKYYIDDIPINQTEFRYDPEYPRLSEKVNELIIDNSGEILTGNVINKNVQGKIMIPDIESEDDMRSFVSNLPGEDVLLAGASDFFRSILIFKMKLTHQQEAKPYQKAAFNHFIIGSQSESSKHTMRLLSQKEYCEFHLPVSAIHNETDFNEWLLLILKDISDDKQIAVSGPVERIEDQSEIKEILYRLVRVAKLMVEKSSPGSQFFIEGGETASSFCRTMGWDDLQVHYVWNEGAVLLANKDSDTRIAIKPGSYQWPESILK